MRRRTVRNGLRLLLASLALIILASFYHSGVAELFAFSPVTGVRMYGLGMALAAAVGAYGVVLAVAGLILPTSDRRDAAIRIAPLFVLVACAVALFFYLFMVSFSSPDDGESVPPGTVITI